MTKQEQQKKDVVKPLEDIEKKLDEQVKRAEQAEKQMDQSESSPGTMSAPQDFYERPDFGNLS